MVKQIRVIFTGRSKAALWKIANQYKASSSRIQSSEGGRKHFNRLLTDADGQWYMCAYASTIFFNKM